MLIPVQSPWLPGYVIVLQTILIILTMAGFLLGRPRILSWSTEAEGEERRVGGKEIQQYSVAPKGPHCTGGAPRREQPGTHMAVTEWACP